MTNELSPPICYGPQADDAYMGYAPRDEILAALKELLEAERAIRGRFSLSRPDAGGQSRHAREGRRRFLADVRLLDVAQSRLRDTAGDCVPRTRAHVARGGAEPRRLLGLGRCERKGRDVG